MLYCLYYGLSTLFSTVRGGTLGCSHHLLAQVILVGTIGCHHHLISLQCIGEIAMMAGHMFFSRSNRELPYWPAEVGPFSLYPLSSLFFRYPLLNNLCAAGLLICLVLSLSNPEAYLLPGVLLFWLLCLVDSWRLITYHQWLLGVTGLLFLGPVPSLQIHMASLYFWSGFQKLVMKDFYEGIAPIVFEPITDILSYALAPLSSKSEFIRNQQENLFLFVYGSGVFFEMLLGALLMFPRSVSPLILTLTLVFNVFLHLYIIAFIGYKNGILTFWSWNLLCMATTQLTFSPSTCLRETLDIFSPAAPLQRFSAWHAFLFLVFAAYPATVLFGKCLNGVLSHTYFAPGW